MDFQEKLSKYAEVLVKIGLDLRKGQPVCIESPVEESVLAAEIARQAYLAGASEVEVLWKCDSLQAIQLAHQDLSVTQAHTALAEHCAAKGAGFIRLDTVDLTTFSGLSPEKVNQKAAADVAARSIFREKAGGCGQTIACVPTQSWADLVYPDLPQEQRLSALWDAVFACCRCDCADPVAAWKKYIADTTLRKQKLDSKQYKAFHYRSAKTDLTIAPVDHQMWMGGCMEMPDGRVFVPNIPTEEVFTTPNKYSANGYVSSTKPLNYRGQIIDGFKLYLENGKIGIVVVARAVLAITMSFLSMHVQSDMARVAPRLAAGRYSSIILASANAGGVVAVVLLGFLTSMTAQVTMLVLFAVIGVVGAAMFIKPDQSITAERA